VDDQPSTLNSQLLTPARLMWVLDIGESTEAAWREQKMISFFRQGRIVRYDPAAVLAFIARNSVRARSLKSNVQSLKSTTGDVRLETLDWVRIERLIGDQIEAHGLKGKYPLSKAA